METVPGWIASYGQLGIMLWMIFEIRDVKRWLKNHVEFYHADRREFPRDG